MYLCKNPDKEGNLSIPKASMKYYKSEGQVLMEWKSLLWISLQLPQQNTLGLQADVQQISAYTLQA